MIHTALSYLLFVGVWRRGEEGLVSIMAGQI